MSGQMIIIAQKKKKTLDMTIVLTQPFEPLPWSLASEDGSIRKTNKAILARALQNDMQAEDISTPSAIILDEMALIQKIRAAQKTLGQIANAILRFALRDGTQSQKTGIVFDV